MNLPAFPGICFLVIWPWQKHSLFLQLLLILSCPFLNKTFKNPIFQTFCSYDCKVKSTKIQGKILQTETVYYICVRYKNILTNIIQFD